MQLLTDKPVLYVCNVDESSAVNGNAYVDQVRQVAEDEQADVLVLAVSTEADINELDTYEERQLFLDDMGLTEPGAAIAYPRGLCHAKFAYLFYCRSKRSQSVDSSSRVNCSPSGWGDSHRF